MSNKDNGNGKVSAELKKIMDSYRRLADQPGGAGGHAMARIQFPTAEAPVTDERDREEIDREFREVVDRFIQLANEQIETVQREHVSLALLYAAARFNSFVVSTHAPSKEKFHADRKSAFEFFTKEYRRMLEENLDDYERVYETRNDPQP
jgi:hypothetical protein